MKKTPNIVLSFVFCLLSFIFYAQQNLVPNPSFESYTTCPTTGFQIQYAVGWNTYQNTPDYFNTCASIGSDVNVPYIFAGLGYQNAASGNAYAGFYSIEGNDPTGNEIVGCQLASSLTIGTKYYLSFKLNLSIIDSSQFANTATNHLGALFSTKPYSFTNPIPIANHAHIYTNTIITDTMNWTKVSGSFIADSVYKFIAFGNFFDSTHTQTHYFFNEPHHLSYYLIDDICVSTDSIFTANYIWTEIKGYDDNQPKINLYPNPSINGIFYTNAAFINQQIEVFDVLGKSLNKEYINGNTINLNYLANGLYILQFDNNYCTRQKIIINK